MSIVVRNPTRTKWTESGDGQLDMDPASTPSTIRSSTSSVETLFFHQKTEGLTPKPVKVGGSDRPPRLKLSDLIHTNKQPSILSQFQFSSTTQFQCFVSNPQNSLRPKNPKIKTPPKR